jgi:ABC-type transport system substrate-binding protein
VKKSTWFSVLSLMMVISMLLAACQPGQGLTGSNTAKKTPWDQAKALKVDAGSCDYGGEFKAIEAVDEFTVKFTLCKPDPAFLSKVAFDVFAIADTATLEKTGGDSIKLSDEANGTGPFKIKSWTRGDNITYEANTNYWGKKPAFKTLIIKWSEQSAQRLLELQAGTVDGIDNPAPEDFATISGDSKLKLYPRDPLNVFYIGFNNTIAPFDNEKIRQAIAYAIDRDRIVKEYYPANSMVATVFVPPALKPGWSETNPWYKYDPEKAKALLKEAGWVDGTEVKLSFRNVVRGYLPTPDKVAQEIQAQLAEVGIKVNIDQQESATFLDNTAAGKEGFFLLGWGADYPDASNFYDYHFANDASATFGKLFPDIADPIRKAAQVADPAERQKLYDTVNANIKTHVPMIPVAHGTSAVAFAANVKNAMTGPLGNEPFYIMDPGKENLVFLQGGEPAALFCQDETDGESLRACQQIYEPLMRFKDGSVEVEPALAASYTVNTDATEWVFKLRQGVTFHGGENLDANDVVKSFKVQWDATDPLHKGRTGTFEYFGAFFGTSLNAPKK